MFTGFVMADLDSFKKQRENKALSSLSGLPKIFILALIVALRHENNQSISSAEIVRLLIIILV